MHCLCSLLNRQWFERERFGFAARLAAVVQESAVAQPEAAAQAWAGVVFGQLAELGLEGLHKSSAVQLEVRQPLQQVRLEALLELRFAPSAQPARFVPMKALALPHCRACFVRVRRQQPPWL